MDRGEEKMKICNCNECVKRMFECMVANRTEMQLELECDYLRKEERDDRLVEREA